MYVRTIARVVWSETNTPPIEPDFGIRSLPIHCPSVVFNRSVNTSIPIHSPPPAMPIEVLLADEHPIVYQGITSTASDLKVTARVSRVDKLIEALNKNLPDVLITEVRLGGQDVLKAIEAFREKLPELKVVVYSGWDNPTYVARAASIGCNDFVPKSKPVESLLQAVHNVANNVALSEDSLIVQTQSKMRRPRQVYDHDVPLTNREMQVLRHIAMGLSNREIGKSLEISVETVKEHVQNILRKLDVNDRTQAAVWAVKRGLA